MTETETTELSLASLELVKLEACVELMLFAAYADGSMGPEERAAFEAQVEKATLGQLRPEIVRTVLGVLESTIKEADPDARVRRIAERITDPRLRRGVLWLAATIAMADGKLLAEERSFLERAGAAFALTKDEIAKTLDRH